MNTPHTHIYATYVRWRFPTCMGTTSAAATPKRATCFVALRVTRRESPGHSTR